MQPSPLTSVSLCYTPVPSANLSYLGPLKHMPIRTSSAKPILPNIGDTHSVGTGLRGVTFYVPLGAAANIATFYADVFGARTAMVPVGGGADGDRPPPPTAEVAIGHHQWLRFEEAANVPAYDGVHIAIYVNNFLELYRCCRSRGLVWNNLRFRQRYDTEADALRHNEFRILYVGGGAPVDSEGAGIPAYALEHEVRSLAHPGFAFTLQAVEEQNQGED